MLPYVDAADLGALAGARPIVLWGAGRAGLAALRHLRDRGVEPCAFVDSSPAKQGTLLDGLPVRAPGTLSEGSRDARPLVVVTSIHARAILGALEALGFAPGADGVVLPPPLALPDDSATERIACPFCDATDAVVVRRRADIVRCAGCSTVYLRTRPTPAAMRAMYREYVDAGSHIALPRDAADVATYPLRREDVLDELASMGVRSGRLLDVGCSWGPLLAAARDRGFTPFGIEVTRRAVEYAVFTLGLPVADVDVDALDAPAGTFGAVTMIHSLEHLPRPRPALAKVHALLAPGGVLLGRVPNFASACSTRLADHWHWLDPNVHYVHYTPDTLRAHLTSTGFVVERLSTVTGDYLLADVIDVLRDEAAGAGRADVPDDALIEAAERDGRGEEIRVVARKTATGS